MEKRIKILSSWDDAGNMDMTLAQLLMKYKIPAVFYIPMLTRDLTDYEIRKLAGTEPNCDMCKVAKKLFDVGAHTMTHPEDMKELSYPDLKYEIEKSKKGLEMIANKPVTRFCYPSGRFNEQVKKVVIEAGFKEARTVRPLSLEFPKDVFETDPTIHVHPKKAEYGSEVWKTVAQDKFDEVLEKGGRFELWGHSFEIERYNMWEFLEDFLYYMDKKMTEIGYPREIAIPYYKVNN